MAKNDHVHIPIGVEHFCSFVLGKTSNHAVAGSISRKSWIKLLSKLHSHFQRYVKANVVSDKLHEERIDRVIARLGKAIKDGARESEVSTLLLELCFLFIGDTPNHSKRKAINRPEYFLLDRVRTVHYSQSPKQRAELIVRTFIEPKLSDQGTEGEEAETLWLKYLRTYSKRHRHAEFVTWFRENHSKQYLDLFG